MRQKHIIGYNLSSLIHLKDVVDHQPHTHLNIFPKTPTDIRFSQPLNALSAQTLFEYPCQRWNIIFFIIIEFTLYWRKEKKSYINKKLWMARRKHMERLESKIMIFDTILYLFLYFSTWGFGYFLKRREDNWRRKN